MQIDEREMEHEYKRKGKGEDSQHLSKSGIKMHNTLRIHVLQSQQIFYVYLQKNEKE